MLLHGTEITKRPLFNFRNVGIRDLCPGFYPEIHKKTFPVLEEATKNIVW
jgi:hypothetical protein